MVTTHRRLEDEHELAARLGLNASQVIPTELGRLRLQQVPTLVLVDRSGTVHRVLRASEFESGLDRFGASMQQP